MSKRELSIAFLATLFSFCLVWTDSLARGRIERVRYSVNNGKTRIVIDCNSSFPYKVRTFDDPPRIAVNLTRVDAAKNLGTVQIPQGAVKRIRLNRLSWGTQLVLDLRRQARWKHFALKRSKAKPDRIVIDVWGKSSATKVSTGSGNVIVIAVDAGHGGMDPGAIGKYNLVEKRVSLDIARRIARNINKKRGFSAFLIREGDRFLPLEERTKIARDKRADAFVSIHLNWARKRSARGVEVFFLSPSGAAAKTSKLLKNKKEAQRELGLHGGNSDEVLYMILDVNQQTMMLRSSLLAESILQAINRRNLPPVRGIKQRSFAVLKTIFMPSVIVEVGFLSNLYDARILKSENGRENIAMSIARGIEAFFSKYPPPKGGNRSIVVHRVRKGDTLWTIAKAYGTSVSSLKKVNKLGRSNKIRIGQEIIVMEGD